MKEGRIIQEGGAELIDEINRSGFAHLLGEK